MEYRVSTLAERKEFYEKEFSLKKVESWFRGRELPQLCAVDAGDDSGVIVDKKYAGSMFYFQFSELREKIKKYVPEDVYYDRNKYADPKKILRTLEFKEYLSQEFAFDIDADNIKRDHPKSQLVCDKCVDKTYRYAVRMKRELNKDFRKTRLVYSGRGFHVHILDEKSFKMNIKEREALNRRFSKYPIDPWVSRGYIRLIRMPYSLNGLVSRVVTPVNVKKGFRKESTYPSFLKD